ncbi:MAG: type II secretion system protein, partial [Tepidisphaeraceae bacterium]
MPRARRRTAFTLIELLVVVGVTLILVGMLFIGGKYVFASVKSRATVTSLNSLKGMLDSYERVTKFNKSPPAWVWWNGSQSVNPPKYVDINGDLAPDYAVNFWTLPPFLGNNTNNIARDSLDAPGSVVADGNARTVNQRNASRAVVNTSLAMSMILAVPENRTVVQNMS